MILKILNEMVSDYDRHRAKRAKLREEWEDEDDLDEEESQALACFNSLYSSLSGTETIKVKLSSLISMTDKINEDSNYYVEDIYSTQFLNYLFRDKFEAAKEFKLGGNYDYTDKQLVPRLRDAKELLLKNSQFKKFLEDNDFTWDSFIKEVREQLSLDYETDLIDALGFALKRAYQLSWADVYYNSVVTSLKNAFTFKDIWEPGVPIGINVNTFEINNLRGDPEVIVSYNKEALKPYLALCLTGSKDGDEIAYNCDLFRDYNEFKELHPEKTKNVNLKSIIMYIAAYTLKFEDPFNTTEAEDIFNSSYFTDCIVSLLDEIEMY